MQSPIVRRGENLLTALGVPDDLWISTSPAVMGAR
jgi:hypothetical protein